MVGVFKATFITFTQLAIHSAPLMAAACAAHAQVAVTGINLSTQGTPTLNVSGAIAPTMNINSISGLGGNFRCIVTSACGGGSVTSNEATLTINTCGPVACSLADIVGGDGNPPEDASVDGNDFQAFLNSFAAGC